MVKRRSPKPKSWVRFLAGVPILNVYFIVIARLWDSYFLHTEDKIGSIPIRATMRLRYEGSIADV